VYVKDWDSVIVRVDVELTDGGNALSDRVDVFDLVQPL
jgi:hypothetical protein